MPVDRPARKRPVADIEAREVARLLVKDMTRIGRNDLQTGFYAEIMFREHGVLFAAIANSVDGDDQFALVPQQDERAVNVFAEYEVRVLAADVKIYHGVADGGTRGRDDQPPDGDDKGSGCTGDV